MGSASFTRIVQTTAAVNDAYRQAVAEDEHAFGTDHGNGTISTTEGVGHVHTTPVTYDEARRIMEERIDNLSKWAPCEAISLVHEEPAQYEPLATKDVTLTVKGEQYSNPDTLKTLIAEELGVSVDQIDRYQAYAPGHPVPRVKVTPAVTAVAPEEKTETRYFIITKASGLPRWDDGHPTQAAARAALTSVLGRNAHGYQFGPVEAEVIAMTRRTTGEPLVTATVYAKQVEATLTVTLRKKVKDAIRGTTHAAWLFYGWAAT